MLALRFKNKVAFRTNLSETEEVRGSEFIRRVQDIGREAGQAVSFVPQRGKGSHGTLYLGSKRTVVRNPKDELKKGTFHAMLKQLGLRADQF
jgi:mRNA interferase HicA